MSARSPTAAGTLAKTPFAHLLVYCLDRELTGSLELHATSGATDTIFFEGGAPVKIRTAELVAPLGEMLVELGALQSETRDDLLTRQARVGGLLGETLLDRGHLDRRSLRAVLRTQLRRKLAALTGRPDTTRFEFHEDVNLLDGWGSDEVVPIEPLALIMSSVRQRPPPERLAAMVTKLAATPLVLHPDGDTDRLEPSPIEERALDVLRSRSVTLTELESCGVAPVPEVRALVYALLITRYVDTGETTRLPVGAGLPPPPSSSRISIAAAPVARVQLLRGTDFSLPSVIEVNASRRDSSSGTLAPLSPRHEALRVDIHRLAEDLPRLNHFEVLGVPRTATADQIKTAFFDLAKRYHPDRVPDRLSTSREGAAKIFARMSEAFRTLSDAKRRTDYEATLGEEGEAARTDEQEHVARVTEAAFEFQKAEILLKNGDVDGAARFVTRALSLDPAQADYRALTAWLSTIKPAGKQATNEELTSAVKILDGLLSETSEHQRALWYRGSLLKRLGEIDRAARDFRLLCALDPHHIDAARELRLYQMRNPKRGPSSSRSGPASSRGPSSTRKPTPAPGFLGRLFNKK